MSALGDAIRGMVDLLTEQVPTHRDFLQQIIVADGRQAGQPLSVEGHPAQEALVWAFDSGKYRRFAWAKPVQDGGTLLMLVPLLRRAVIERQTVVLAYPTVDAAKDIWTTKVWPILAAYGGQEPEKGGGSKGGAARVVKLPGGGMFILRAAGGRGESGQASITGDALGVDEVDDWPDLHRIELIGHRINESVDPLSVYNCTVKRDKDSLILSLVSDGTNARLCYPCMSCGLVQPLEWDKVVVANGTYRCDCGHEWTDEQRRQSLRKWTLSMANPTSAMFSIRWSALDSPRHSMLSLVDQFRRATIKAEGQEHGPLRSFYRDRLTREYTADIQTDEDATAPLTHALLAERSRRTAWSTIGENRDEGGLWSRYWSDWPEAGEFAVPAIDVQHNRLYWSAVGLATDERTWDVGWGTDYAHAGTDSDKPAPFAPGELTSTLDRVADYLDEQLGDRLRVGVVDTGDLAAEFADELIEWLRNRRRWRACRGIDTLPRIRPDGDYQARVDGLVCWEKRWKPGLGRYVIGSEASWRVFQAGYRRAPGTKGAAHLPGPLKAGNVYLRHLSAKGERTLASGAVVFKEQPGGGRHDYGDARGYATAVGLALLRGDPAPPPADDDMAPAPSGHRGGGGFLAGFGIGKL